MKIDKADSTFSLYIRTRDKWTCQRCHTVYTPPTSGLHCSHYFGRGRESTRFEPDNCIALCFGCHRLWGHGDQRDSYKEFMIDWLGQRRFDTLTIQAHTYAKKNRKMSLIIAKELLNGN